MPLRNLPYIGGKYHLVKEILKLIPPHKTYVEVFGGMGYVLLNKPKSKVEVYNDIDDYFVDYFKVLRDKEKRERLKELISLTPFARKVFDEAVEKLRKKDFKDIVDKVYNWIIVIEMNYIRTANIEKGKPSFKISIKKNMAIPFHNRVFFFDIIGERIKDVVLECKDFRYILKRYCKTEMVFAYLDPPYLSTSTAKSFTYTMTEKDHEDMLKMVNSLPAKFLISGYNNELYDKYLKNWNKKEIEMVNFQSPKRSKKVEVLWWNYKI
jgi:DNA adenine methylase